MYIGYISLKYIWYEKFFQFCRYEFSMSHFFIPMLTEKKNKFNRCGSQFLKMIVVLGNLFSLDILFLSEYVRDNCGMLALKVVVRFLKTLFSWRR